MGALWKRMGSAPKNWRGIFKAIELLEYLLQAGSQRVTEEARERIHRLRQLEHFTFDDPKTGQDKGKGVRNKAAEVVKLLKNDRQLHRARDAFKANRSKYKGMSHDGSGGQSYGGYGGYGGQSRGYGGQRSQSRRSPARPTRRKPKPSARYEYEADDSDEERKRRKKSKKKKKKSRRDDDDDDDDFDDFDDSEEESKKKKKKRKKRGDKARRAQENEAKADDDDDDDFANFGEEEPSANGAAPAIAAPAGDDGDFADFNPRGGAAAAAAPASNGGAATANLFGIAAPAAAPAPAPAAAAPAAAADDDDWGTFGDSTGAATAAPAPAPAPVVAPKPVITTTNTANLFQDVVSQSGSKPIDIFALSTDLGAAKINPSAPSAAPVVVEESSTRSAKPAGKVDAIWGSDLVNFDENLSSKAKSDAKKNAGSRVTMASLAGTNVGAPSPKPAASGYGSPQMPRQQPQRGGAPYYPQQAAGGYPAQGYPGGYAQGGYPARGGYPAAGGMNPYGVPQQQPGMWAPQTGGAAGFGMQPQQRGGGGIDSFFS